ncbi:hypothetical protein V8C37DRAFT_398076 [Trichoderma ceciliae]
MCGRYSLALPPSLIRQMLEDDGVPIGDAPNDEGSEAPHQSYNFAPGYCGVVCRADTPDNNAELRRKYSPIPENESRRQETVGLDEHGIPAVKYKLQSMRWGIVPSWSKQSPGSTPKAINCRDDSLRTRGGMWQSMKARKRCIVVAQGFFEWLNVNGKDKNPYFIKRRDGRLMYFAGLWDSIQHKDTGYRTYTYAVVTTNSNQQLGFLHNRMPVIFDADSKDFRQWLHPLQHRWTNDLQSLLKPYGGELEIYPVDKNVGKVGCSSPSFIIPLDDKGNGHDIAHFFPPVSQSSVAEKPGGSGKIRTYESDDDQHISITSAEPSLCKGKEAHKKHELDGSHSPPLKKRQVKPGPSGVKRITDFFK